MTPDATAICAGCGKVLVKFPVTLREMLPVYWMAFCDPYCINLFVDKMLPAEAEK